MMIKYKAVKQPGGAVEITSQPVKGTWIIETIYQSQAFDDALVRVEAAAWIKETLEQEGVVEFSTSDFDLHYKEVVELGAYRLEVELSHGEWWWHAKPIKKEVKLPEYDKQATTLEAGKHNALTAIGIADSDAVHWTRIVF